MLWLIMKIKQEFQTPDREITFSAPSRMKTACFIDQGEENRVELPKLTVSNIDSFLVSMFCCPEPLRSCYSRPLTYNYIHSEERVKQ